MCISKKRNIENYMHTLNFSYHMHNFLYMLTIHVCNEKEGLILRNGSFSRQRRGRGAVVITRGNTIFVA